ncbi:MAG: hypothetical protein J0649_07475 [Methylococcales bacterium]|nr:hypothetical protein [Methylococcales bacterium]
MENTITEKSYFSPVMNRYERPDLVEHMGNVNVLFSGIKCFFDISGVSHGNYTIYIAGRVAKRVVMTRLEVEIEIV